MAKYPELRVWEQVVQTQTLSLSLDNPELGWPPLCCLSSGGLIVSITLVERVREGPAWLATSLPWKLTFHTPDSHTMLG